MEKILVGNTFPVALIRRRVLISPVSVAQAKAMLKNFASFWGHANTLAAAKEQLGVDVAPKTERPAIQLGEDNFPILDGELFRKVLVLSPSYANGFRPAIGEEVSSDKIVGWQCLLFDFNR